MRNLAEYSLYSRWERAIQRYILAIHAVCHAAMARDALPEILDTEGTLEARSKESPERCNKGREACHEEQVDLVRRVRNGGDLLT